MQWLLAGMSWFMKVVDLINLYDAERKNIPRGAYLDSTSGSVRWPEGLLLIHSLPLETPVALRNNKRYDDVNFVVRGPSAAQRPGSRLRPLQSLHFSHDAITSNLEQILIISLA